MASSRGAGAGRAGGRSSGAKFGGAGGGRRGVGGGAGRTGAVRRGAGTGAGNGAPRPKVEKNLGGEQVEGRQAVRELLIAGRRKVRELWIATELEESEVIGDIVDLARSQRVQIQDVNRKRLDMAARSEAPQGVIAFAAPLPETPFEELLKRRPGRAPFLVAVDGVTDPGNLGAILRSADGAGVSGVVMPRHRAVHVTPTTAKSAAGAIEHVPMSLVPGLPNALSRMKESGIWIVGLDDGGDRNLFELGDLAAEGICLVMGAEGAGLSRLVRERCDLIVHIPMRGRLSSLNVSAAAALAMYEVARHR
jgi:23S rRNA (guanosine2251-2'-O)-methyltransferase